MEASWDLCSKQDLEDNKNSKSEQWKYVSSKDNPTHDGSGGLDATYIK